MMKEAMMMKIEKLAEGDVADEIEKKRIVKMQIIHE